MRWFTGIIFYINLLAVALQLVMLVDMILALGWLFCLGIYQSLTGIILAAVSANRREWLPYIFFLPSLLLLAIYTDFPDVLVDADLVIPLLILVSFYHLWLTYRSFGQHQQSHTRYFRKRNIN